MILPRRTAIVFLAALLIGTPTSALADANHEKAHQDLDLQALEKPGPWGTRLMPFFEAAARRHDVPLPLLLALGYFGSAFENRGGASTIEGGYGVMALRKNVWGANSLSEGAALEGVPERELKLHPGRNINAAAAVLSSSARMLRIDRSRGLEAWLEPVIIYAGLDEENSRFFAMEVFQKLRDGLDWTNSNGERFYFPPQDIGSVDLGELEPSQEAQAAPASIIASTDYPPAIWDPAASCNYTATYTSKDTIVVHTIEGTAAGARAWFKNCSSQVSAHYVISEAGGVWQCVREMYKAWHAGCYNSRSIGLEHEGYAASPSHPRSLYDASALLSRDICDDWGIPKEKRTVGPGIIGHIDVTRCCCGTHTDPGNGWDWGYYIQQVNGTPPPPIWAASFYAQSYPSTMTAGTTAIAWVEYVNQGTGHWKHSETFLGTSSPQDRSSPFCNPANWVSCNRPTDVDQSDVAQGQIGRFTFILKAPSTPGTYVERYRLVREGITWFGDEITWTINVTAATGNITGTVRNAANGQPIPGASVVVSGGPSASTNSSGIYTFTGLAPATYMLSVSATGYNPASDTATVNAGETTIKDFNLVSSDTTPPSAPTSFAAVGVSPSQINLTWNASTDIGGSGLAGYIVYRGGAEVGRTASTSFQDNGLVHNTTYSYYVRAYDNANNVSPPSNTAEASTLPGEVPIFEDGFANTDYWEAIVQSPMPGPYPPVLTSEKNHGTFPGAYSLRTVTSSDPNQGCLIGHRFEPAFATARFESYFFDGSGVGYISGFENGTDGWASYPSAYATLSTVGGGVSGNCLQASDGGWTSGAYREIAGGFTAGEAYSLSMWAKWPPPPSGKSYSTPPRCFVRFLDGSGAEIRTDYSANITTDNEWHQYAVSGSVPAGTAKIWIGHWGVLGATQTYQYFADSVVFSTNTGAAVSNSSRQGLQVRCIGPEGSLRAIYYVGTYSAAPGSFSTYSAGYYKLCGSGCTGWYWPGAAVMNRTAGWHKFGIEFLPYTGAGNEVRFYIDGVQVATAERTPDTQIYGLNMVAYGYHYRVNVESWFDDCAMYAAAPVAPTMGTPTALSNSAIRWNITDNSNNEIGFKVQDASQSTRATAPAQNGTGSPVAIDEGGLAANTPYTRLAKAYNGTLDSLPTAAATRWTLSNPPTPSNVICDRVSGTWYNTPSFTFTAVGGFGQGTVERYRYSWDASPTHIFTEAEPVWNSGQLILVAPASGSYYLHLQGYNGEDVPNGTLDLGPYRFDGIVPLNPTSAVEMGGAANGAWQSSVSDPSFIWSGASDAGSGVAAYLVYFGQDEGGTSFTEATSASYDPPAVTTGTYYLRVRAKDAAGNLADEWVTLFIFRYDATAPERPTVTDDGPYTASRNVLHAAWHSSDPECGISEYEYAVGTSPGAMDLVGWTPAGSAREADIDIPEPGLVIGPTYYISIRAKNGAGVWSEAGSSDGIRVVPSVATIAEAKSLEDGTPVGLTEKIVTASFPGSFYIEEADRSSGILVLGPGPDRGALVSIGGIMGANGVGERAILEPVTNLLADPDPARVPPPVFLILESLGGSALNAYTPGRTGGFGLNNVGLLVQVCGKVEWVGEHEFIISDGSSVGPVRIIVPWIAINGLDVGDVLSVIGISSLEVENGVIKPIIRLIEGEGIKRQN